MCSSSLFVIYYAFLVPFLQTLYFSSFAVPDGPPLEVTVVAKSSSSLSVTWNKPERDKRKGIIVNYTLCISHEEIKPCFKEYTTTEKILVIDNLNISTEYYVRVLASTKVGRGMYSNSTKKFTNAGKSAVMYTTHMCLPFAVALFTVV
jgi:hypothetical protein